MAQDCTEPVYAGVTRCIKRLDIIGDLYLSEGVFATALPGSANFDRQQRIFPGEV